MSLSDTDREEVALERLKDAQKALQDLIHFAESANKQMESEINQGRIRSAYPISWGAMMMEKLTVIICEISRCNGALLVQGTTNKVALG